MNDTLSTGCVFIVYLGSRKVWFSNIIARLDNPMRLAS